MRIYETRVFYPPRYAQTPLTCQRARAKSRNSGGWNSSSSSNNDKEHPGDLWRDEVTKSYAPLPSPLPLLLPPVICDAMHIHIYTLYMLVPSAFPPHLHTYTHFKSVRRTTHHPIHKNHSHPPGIPSSYCTSSVALRKCLHSVTLPRCRTRALASTSSQLHCKPFLVVLLGKRPPIPPQRHSGKTSARGQ